MAPSGDIASIGGISTSDLAAFVTLAGLAFNELRNNQRLSATQRTNAEVSLSEAFDATEAYYKALEQGQPKDSGAEHQIAALWDKAAAHFLNLNEDLANRLGFKSEFWRNGAAWSDSEIEAKRISLVDVRDAGYLSTR